MTDETGTSSKDAVHRPQVSRSVAAPAEAVWAVLADGWQYATWVVGASRVRAVDAGWEVVAVREGWRGLVDGLVEPLERGLGLGGPRERARRVAQRGGE